MCSPSYLHRSHLGFARRSDADAICEIPLVLAPAQIDELAALDRETGRTVHSIQQLRLHSSIIAVKEQVEPGPPDRVYDVDMSYFASHGLWCYASRKGDKKKSGVIATNNGMHFVDMLTIVFDPPKFSALQLREADLAAGYLASRQARVRWIVSTNHAHLSDRTPAGQSTFYSIAINDDEIEFSSGFTDLHTASYQEILEVSGFGLDAELASIQLLNDIGNVSDDRTAGQMHLDAARITGE